MAFPLKAVEMPICYLEPGDIYVAGVVVVVVVAPS